MLRRFSASSVHAIVHTATYAAGAICSTVDDLITWLQALHGGKVMTPKSYVEMITPTRLSDGTSTRYAMGLAAGEDRGGMRFIGHDGGGFGFSSQTRWYRGAQLAVLPAPPPARRFVGDASLLTGTYKGLGRGKDTVIVVTQASEGIAFAFDGAAASALPWVENWTFRQAGLGSDLSPKRERRSGDGAAVRSGGRAFHPANGSRGIPGPACRAGHAPFDELV
ncbi:MAG: serine hydrolase [Acidobacteriota bacterium]|nr:serine hydrolase [Acidobacteriota bacterium]